MKKIITFITLSAQLSLCAMETDLSEHFMTGDNGAPHEQSSSAKRKFETFETENSEEKEASNSDPMPALKKKKSENECESETMQLVRSDKSISFDGAPLEELSGAHASALSIEVLPAELFGHILSSIEDKHLLTSVALVCHRWHDFIEDNYIWSLKLHNQAVQLPPLRKQSWDSHKTIYLFWGLPRNKALLDQVIFRTFGNFDAIDEFSAGGKYGDELNIFEGQEEATFNVPITRATLNHLFFSPEIIKTLYGDDHLTFYHDLQAWHAYTDQFRLLLWMYRLVDENFKDPLESGTIQTFDPDVLTLNLDYDAKSENPIKLRSIPRHIFLLESVLRQLNMSDHALPDIPGKIHQFSNMNQLNLDGNQIKCVPASLFTMPNLSTDLQNNQIACLDNCLEEVTNEQIRLSYLNLGSNPIGDRVPKHVMDRVDEVWLGEELLSGEQEADL